jgi:hypothetical protein
LLNTTPLSLTSQFGYSVSCLTKIWTHFWLTCMLYLKSFASHLFGTNIIEQNAAPCPVHNFVSGELLFNVVCSLAHSYSQAPWFTWLATSMATQFSATWSNGGIASRLWGTTCKVSHRWH